MRRANFSTAASSVTSFALSALLLAHAPAHADDKAEAGPIGRWLWSISIGASAWSDLADLDSSSGRRFDSLGFVLELAGHRRVGRWGAADVLLGGELGLFTTDGDIPGTLEDYTQRGLYLTPSVKFRFGERRSRYLSLEAGLGWYSTDFAELLCGSNGSICVELNAPFESDTLGMYLGLGAGFGRWFVTGLRVHYADFGRVTGIGSIEGNLNGPFYLFTLGAAFGG